MPVLKNDGTVVVNTSVSTSKNYDYNLALHNSYGLSIQLAYTNTSSINSTASLQASNDEVHFVDIPSTLVTISGNGSTIWDVSNSAFKTLRVVYTRTAGTADLTLTYNSLNFA